jgi:hypothetical protein
VSIGERWQAFKRDRASANPEILKPLDTHVAAFLRRTGAVPPNTCSLQVEQVGLERLKETMAQLPPPAQERYCAAPECAQPSSPQKCCAKCRVVSYCSKECQKVHWTHPLFSHRFECACALCP